MKKILYLFLAYFRPFCPRLADTIHAPVRITLSVGRGQTAGSVHGWGMVLVRGHLSVSETLGPGNKYPRNKNFKPQ
jgi:hypothetical protein